MTSLILSTLGVSLAGLGVLILRNRQTRAQGGELIRLVTSRHLGGKRFLTVVEVDGERLLLGLAGDNIRLITRLGNGLEYGELEYGLGGGESRRRPSEHGAAGAARTGASGLPEGERLRA